MRAATTTVDITPHGMFWMEGYVHPVRKKPATGVHDTPVAVLLLVEQGGREVLFVSMDVCIVTAAETASLRSGLASTLAIDEDSIIINSIHSHSCASGFEGTDSMGVPPTPGYVQLVTGLVIGASTRLRPEMTEVIPELLSTHVRGWYSNRNDADRPFDDEAYVLRLASIDGAVAGAMLNFNCHATVVGPTNRMLTSDVIGGVRSEIAEWVGVVPYVFTGASADLGNRQFRRGNDFAELRRVSNGIAGEIMGASFETVRLAPPKIWKFSHHVCYDNKRYYPEYRKQLADVLDVLAGNPSFDEAKLAETEREMLELQLTRGHVEFDISMTVADFGEIVFVTFPGELASDLGAYVKASFGGRRTILIGYANDYQGYFVPEGDFGGTSYESYVTRMPRGWIERVLSEFRLQAEGMR